MASSDTVASGTARYRIVAMVPDHAVQLLKGRRPSARRHAGAVRAYSQSMRDQTWVLNGMPIIVSRQGVLLDGVQRLLACVEGKGVFETFLAEDVEDDLCHTIGQQCSRSFASVLEARGVPHAEALHAALIALMRYDCGIISLPIDRMPSWDGMDRVLRANPHLASAVGASLALVGCILPEPVRSPLICMGYQVDREGTDRLLDALMRPDAYARTEPGVLLSQEIERGADSAVCLLALAIAALDATLRHVPWCRLGAAGTFPALYRYSGLAPAAPAAVFEPAGSCFPNACDAVARPQVSFEIETIDPVRAAEYLLLVEGKRRIGRAHIASIARDLTQGRWMFDAQPICFAQGGRLLNGRHRLRAVILADRPIEVAVVRGLSESAYGTYDNQAKRRTEAGDRLESFGDQALVHSMAHLLWRHECKTLTMGNAKATTAEIQQIVVEHPRLLGLRSFARKMGDFGRASVIGYAAYVMERDDPRLAAIFLAALESGADQRPGHPILALRGALQKLRSSKASQSSQLTVLLAGWERFKARSG